MCYDGSASGVLCIHCLIIDILLVLVLVLVLMIDVDIVFIAGERDQRPAEASD